MKDKQLDVLDEVSSLDLGDLFEANAANPEALPPSYSMARRLLEDGPELVRRIRHEIQAGGIEPSLPVLWLLSNILYGAPEEGPMAVCGNCGSEYSNRIVLGRPRDLPERLDPDGPLPAGECPECGALVYQATMRPEAEEY